MLNFLNDYSEGCFPEILSKLQETNYEKTVGYGDDGYCSQAAQAIIRLCSKPDAQVYFLAGGTQTNQLVIDCLLDSFDGVVSAVSGHVNVHEAGAIEYTGHKVFTLTAHEGKIHADELQQFMADYYADSNYEHMVRPGMVYISHPTEFGTIYSKEELTAIRRVCDTWKLPLYMDGARLACALTAAGNDLSLEDIARLTDVFYIGGTKCGALYGEALVWTHQNMPFRFNTRVKQHGAMLAKGRIPGLQFQVLMSETVSEDGSRELLYIKGGRHANRLADRMKEALAAKGYRFYVDSPTNQIFLIADQQQMDHLAQFSIYSFFEKYDETHTVIRYVTSWATREEDVEAFIAAL